MKVREKEGAGGRSSCRGLCWPWKPQVCFWKVWPEKGRRVIKRGCHDGERGGGEGGAIPGNPWSRRDSSLGARGLGNRGRAASEGAPGEMCAQKGVWSWGKKGRFVGKVLASGP